jgi:hypothetical protein
MGRSRQKSKEDNEDKAGVDEKKNKEAKVEKKEEDKNEKKTKKQKKDKVEINTEDNAEKKSKKIKNKQTKIDISDEDEKSADDETKNESTARPRGRPKKITAQQNHPQQKPKAFELDTSKEKSSILLHIPLPDDSSSEISEKDQFTMKDYDDSEDENKNAKKDTKNKVNTSNFIMYLSDNDEDDDDHIKTLKNKMKKKDEIIKKLKDEINIKSDGFNDVSYLANKNKSIDSKILDMKLFNINKDNKCVIGDKTKIACWWCTCNFDNVPCFVPEKYVNGKFYVFGCFCSYNCALSYIMKDDEYKVSNRVSLIKRLYSELYETKEPLYPSPPKELLNKFGGPMTIEEYKNTQHKLEMKEYKMKFNNILQIPFCFEESKKEYDNKRRK